MPLIRHSLKNSVNNRNQKCLESRFLAGQMEKIASGSLNPFGFHWGFWAGLGTHVHVISGQLSFSTHFADVAAEVSCSSQSRLSWRRAPPLGAEQRQYFSYFFQRYRELVITRHGCKLTVTSPLRYQVIIKESLISKSATYTDIYEKHFCTISAYSLFLGFIKPSLLWIFLVAEQSACGSFQPVVLKQRRAT